MIKVKLADEFGTVFKICQHHLTERLKSLSPNTSGFSIHHLQVSALGLAMKIQQQFCRMTELSKDTVKNAKHMLGFSFHSTRSLGVGWFFSVINLHRIDRLHCL